MEVLIAMLISFGILTADDTSLIKSNSDFISVFQNNQNKLDKNKLTDEQNSEIARIFDWGEEG